MATDIKVQGKIKHFGNLKQELDAKKCLDDKTKNLYDHLSKVMDHIVSHCPDEALNKLEEISYLIKKGDQAQIGNFLELNRKKLYNTPGEEQIKKASDQYIKDAKLYFEVSLFIRVIFILILNRKRNKLQMVKRERSRRLNLSKKNHRR